MMLVLYGPTTTGKTNLAIEIAKKYNGELISADSRQIYRQLDIGTGKVSPDSAVIKYNTYWLVDGIKTYGFDIKNPQETFSASAFVDYAKGRIENIQKKKKFPIIVGGTGFYIKSLLFGIGTSGIKPNFKLRKKLEKLTRIDLYVKLLKINHSKAISLNESDKQNPRRLIRAIETSTNKQFTTKAFPISPAQHKIICLSAPNDFLYKRADNWLTTRLKLGINNEVKMLLDQGISPKWLISLGLEYKWITRAIIGEVSQIEATSRLRGDIHSYIRRQKTFIKQFPNNILFDISKKSWKQNLAQVIQNYCNDH